MSRNRIQGFRQLLLRETGTVFKDWGGRLAIALVYPNSYYLGMSNLGIQAIYGLLNDFPHIVCERVFLSRENAKKGRVPVSIESQRPLSDFSVLAFSISYELDYFNVVAILKQSGIPLLASDRDETYPLIIAGGPCITSNPAPLAPFFDCLCIGDAEPILPEILPVINGGIGRNRNKLLENLSKLDGIYVPGFFKGNPVVRQWTNKLDEFPVHSTVLTLDTELGNLYLIEVERGCNWGCRFCMVGAAFSPMRFRSVENLLAQAEEGLKLRKRIGLVGPAVSDHPYFDTLISGLHKMGAELSVSSLRIKPFHAGALAEMIKSGARTIALAPEAGSQRMRDVIRKNITESDILKAVQSVARQGIKQLKLYFMIGLPSETDEDIDAIVNLVLDCKEVFDKELPGNRITLTVAIFVPKAGTPFQMLPMEEVLVLNQRLAVLKNALSPRGIVVKSESPAWSIIQGVLAKGDSNLAKVLTSIEVVSLSGWRKAVKDSGLDIDSIIHNRWSPDIKLPWSMIDSGIKPDYLERELDKALQQNS